MNKKTIRIAGWALGLSMAVAGIGAASFSHYALNQAVTMVNAASDSSYSFNSTSGTATSEKWSFTTAKNSGSTNPAFNEKSSELRLYPKNSITFTAASGYTLSSASFTCKFNKSSGSTITSWSVDHGTITTFSDTLESFTVTSINASSFTITVNGTKGNIGLKTVTMSYVADAPAGNIVPMSIAVSDEESNPVLDGSTYEYNEDIPATLTFDAVPSYSNDTGCVDGTEISWSSSDTDIATVSNGVVTVKDKGTTTITVATTDATNPSENKSLSFTLDTNDATYVSGKHINAPYSVSQACTAIDSGTDAQKNGVYVAGIISQIDEYHSSYKSITYWISADGTTTDQFEVYSGKGLNGADFSSASDLKLGSEVVVYGNIKKYDDIYEFASNNTIVSLTIPTFTVSFNANGGTGTMDPDTDIEIGSYTLPDSGFTAPDGKEFAGWKVNNLGDLLAEGDSYNLTSDVVLYAQWNDLVTLSYDANGGTGSMTGGVYGSGAPVTVKSNAFTAPSGMLFDNWNTQDDGEGTSYAPGAVFNITANTTLYAQWATKVTLSYDGNGSAGGSTASSEYKSGATATVASNGFTAPVGMRFKEWNTQDDGEGTSYAPNASILSFAADLTLYAIWEELPKMVSIAYSGDTTGNMSGDNDAESAFGLDEEKWSVVATKGGHANFPGLNKDGTIRLYASSGNGNSLTVSTLDDAMYIMTATFTFGGTVGSYVVKKGGTTLTGVENVYAVDGTSFYIQNTTASASTQVHISSIDVEWDYVDTFKDAQTFEKNCVKLDIPYPGSTPTGVVGTDCLSVLEGGDGRYHYAKGQYEGLDDQAKIWFATRPEFANARERLIAWGAANHETVSFEEDGSMNVSSAKVVFNSMAESADMKAIIVAAVALVSVVAAGGIFLVVRKHRREEN